MTPGINLKTFGFNFYVDKIIIRVSLFTLKQGQMNIKSESIFCVTPEENNFCYCHHYINDSTFNFQLKHVNYLTYLEHTSQTQRVKPCRLHASKETIFYLGRFTNTLIKEIIFEVINVHKENQKGKSASTFITHCVEKMNTEKNLL